MEKYFDHFDYNSHSVIKILIEKINLFNTALVLKEFEKILEGLNLPDIIIDLKSISYIDSVGIGFLIAAKNICVKNKVEMILISDNEFILKVIRMTKLERFFKIFDTIDEAVKWIENRDK